MRNFGYEKSKRLAKKLYSKLGSISCPAFGGELIAFTNEGFNHLIRKGRIPRTRNEQKRRFRLLPFVEFIIKNPKATFTFRKTKETRKINRHSKTIFITSTASFWTFHSRIKNQYIKVIIRQIHPGQKKFQSIMTTKNPSN